MLYFYEEPHVFNVRVWPGDAIHRVEFKEKPIITYRSKELMHYTVKLTYEVDGRPYKRVFAFQTLYEAYMHPIAMFKSFLKLKDEAAI